MDCLAKSTVNQAQDRYKAQYDKNHRKFVIKKDLDFGNSADHFTENPDECALV